MSDNGDKRGTVAAASTEGERAEPESASEIVDGAARSAESGVGDLVRAVTEAHVFERHEIGGRTVITASAVKFGGGFGFGGGGGSDPSEDKSGAGAGAGGGSQGEGRPVAVIECDANGVRIRPVVDWTKIGALVVTSLVTVWAALRKGRRI